MRSFWSRSSRGTVRPAFSRGFPAQSWLPPSAGAVRVGDLVLLAVRPEIRLLVEAIEPFEVSNQLVHKAGLLFRGIDLSFLSGGEVICSLKDQG